MPIYTSRRSGIDLRTVLPPAAAPHPSRDPRFNPQPGDIVRSQTSKGVRERHVIKRVGNDIWYLAITGSTPGRSREGFCWISTWMEWCRANKVSYSSALGSEK